MGLMKRLRSSRSSASLTKQKSKKLSKSQSKTSEQIVIEDDVGDALFSCSCVSLAVGSFTSMGVSELSSSCRLSSSPDSQSTRSIESYSYDEADIDGRLDSLPSIQEALASRMPSKVFLRTADLPHMKAAADASRHSSFSDLTKDDLVDHIHIPSSTPPLPDIELDPKESWVALDDGRGNRAPLAEAAMEALVKTALDACMDRGMWTASGQTPKLLKSGAWDDTVFRSPMDEQGAVPVSHERGSKGESDVLVWSGTWGHKFYGHDIPCIRCEAIVNMSPRSLADLLVDSSRVKEYNKMSIGRDDILVLNEGEVTVTKICVAKTKPPMISKTLVLKNLLHMEELPGGAQAGYVIASRAIAHTDDAEAEPDPKVVHSEMLMGLNVIRAVEGEPDRCVLINLNHLRSPMIPMMFAKKLGLSAAVNFINDIRALC